MPGRGRKHKLEVRTTQGTTTRDKGHTSQWEQGWLANQEHHDKQR